MLTSNCSFAYHLKAAVKLSALKIQCPNIESAPTCVKLFINTTEMGFDDAEDKKPTEVITLDQKHRVGSGATIP